MWEWLKSLFGGKKEEGTPTESAPSEQPTQDTEGEADVGDEPEKENQ